MRATVRRLLALLAMVGISSCALAFDVGDPSFRLGVQDPIVRVEIFAEWFDRDVDLELSPARIGTPTSGPVFVGPTPLETSTSEEADLTWVRLVFQPLGIVSTQFDIGFDGESSAGDQVMTLGGAARILLTESGPFQLSTQVSAHFVPEFQSKETGTSPVLGPYTTNSDYEAYEYGAALIGSLTAYLSDTTQLVTYMAPRLSTYRGNFISYTDLANTGDRIWIDGVAEQSSPFGLAVGSRLSWGKNLSARIEGRFVDETSLTVGMGASY